MPEPVIITLFIPAPGKDQPFQGDRINSAARACGLAVGVGNIFGAIEFMPCQYPIDLGLTGHNYDYTAYNFRGDAYSSGGLGNDGETLSLLDGGGGGVAGGRDAGRHTGVKGK